MANQMMGGGTKKDSCPKIQGARFKEVKKMPTEAQFLLHSDKMDGCEVKRHHLSGLGQNPF
eukprot:scaffold12096_cov110-Skeletonema_marinoi.AAC.1